MGIKKTENPDKVHPWTPGNFVVAAKKVNGVTVGFIVGWKSRFWNHIRNIRADLIFDTAQEAIDFRDGIENNRWDQQPDFEVID